MIFLGDKGDGFINAEHLKFIVIFIFPGLAEEEVGNFFVKLRHSFRREVDLGR
jgi:hypothetical protein